MKKRLLSVLLMCCMMLTMLPTAAFAESETEEPPVCSCETACTAEAMNADCPICGAEGALPENCAKCAQPADDAAVQPEGEVSDPQPETALTALIGGSETVTEVSTADELTAAIADSNVNTVKLAADISISSSLTVKRTVTLDLNGHVLKYESANKGSPLAVEDSGYLTIKDSGSNATHKFAPNSDGLWVLDETNGTETVYGGVITGGTGYPIQFGSGANVYDAYYGGAVYIKSGGKLTMEGGNIVGCSAVYGGGVYVEGEFVMTGGSIIGCAADRGGGVYMRDNDAVFNMSGSAAIRCCKAVSSIASGGGVYALGAFTMSMGGAISPSGNVSVRGGRDQTFTITPDQGYAVSDVKIDGESVGAVTSYSFENVRKAHTIAVSFATIKIFVDVPVGSYYEDAVDWAVENGITQGTDDTHFSPDGICTRAQAVTFLWRAAGSPEPKTSTMPFTDVNAGSYYYDAVLWAVENGITKGTSDTTFSPNMTCSRAQIVAFLWRSEKSPAAGTANPFADVKSTAYYADAVLWAVKEDITKGTTNTTFSPDADCTRAQIVTFLWRCKK